MLQETWRRVMGSHGREQVAKHAQQVWLPCSVPYSCSPAIPFPCLSFFLPFVSVAVTTLLTKLLVVWYLPLQGLWQSVHIYLALLEVTGRPQLKSRSLGWFVYC